MVANAQTLASEKSDRNDSLLRRALIGNALFSAVSGAVMIGASGWLSDVTGLTPTWLPAAIGAGVLLWAVDVTFIASKQEIGPRSAWLVIGGDLAWIAASCGVLIAGVPDLTTAGKWTVAILAEIVALFALVQYLGLRRTRS